MDIAYDKKEIQKKLYQDLADELEMQDAFEKIAGAYCGQHNFIRPPAVHQNQVPYSAAALPRIPFERTVFLLPPAFAPVHLQAYALLRWLQYLPLQSDLEPACNAIKIYCRSLLDALNERDVACICFYKDGGERI